MWLKKCTCFLLACVAVFGCLFTPVAAAELEEQKVEIEERRASGKFDFDIPAKTLMKASSSFPMEYGETVTITASYRICCDEYAGKEIAEKEQSGLLHNHIMGNGAAESLLCRFH